MNASAAVGLAPSPSEPVFEDRERSRAVLAAISDAVVAADARGRIDHLNRAAEDLLGISADRALGRPAEEVVRLELDRPGVSVTNHPLLLAATEGVAEAEDRWWLVREDGSRVPVEASAAPFLDRDDNVVGGFLICRDISGLLQQQRERAGFFELSLDLVCVGDADGNLLQANPAFLETLGLSSADVRAMPLLALVHPDDRPAAAQELAALASGALMYDFLCRLRRSDGTYRYLEWRATPDPDGLVYFVARDVTEAKRLQAELGASLDEKVVLLQEVHHRVKNNLQIMSSLIGLQIRKLHEETARGALRDCQARIQAIALIHEKLYQSRDYARVPFSSYVQSLVANLLHSRGVADPRIRLELGIEDIELSVDVAIPCGLVLNELIANALQHAFPDGRGGRIRVSLSTLPDARYRLSVVDDGVGLAAAFDPNEVDSLGLQLVATLTEQLDGMLETSGDGGAAFHLTFGGGHHP